MAGDPKQQEEGSAEPLLPDVTRDEHDPGWGDDVSGAERDPDDLERFRREVPPHHGD